MDDLLDFIKVDKNNDSEASSDASESDTDEERNIEEDDDEDEDGELAMLNPANVKIRKDEPSDKKCKEGIDLEEFERDMGWTNKSRKRKPKIDKSMRAIIKDVAPVEDVLKKSVIRPNFECLKRVPRYDASEKKLKLTRKRQREKTKGSKWYDLPATEMTDEIRHDLEIIQKRSALDPKHFYKKNDMKVLPKYFHIGKVMDSPLDYYNGRLTKKERKRTIVDELMADAEFAKYNKRKYKEIIEEKQKTNYKAYRQAKKLKRRKKN